MADELSPDAARVRAEAAEANLAKVLRQCDDESRRAEAAEADLEAARAAITRVKALCDDEYVCHRCPMPSGHMCITCQVRAVVSPPAPPPAAPTTGLHRNGSPCADEAFCPREHFRSGDPRIGAGYK